MRAQEHIVAISIAVLAPLAATSAFASPEYPGIIQKTLNAECVPSCTICHKDAMGGINTVTREFGKALRQAPTNLEAEQEKRLPDVLKTHENLAQIRADFNLAPKLSAEECASYAGDPAPSNDLAGRWVMGQRVWLNDDTDCDGLADIAELRDGWDPNTKGKGNICAFYGCGASRIDPHPTGDPTGFLAAVGVAGLLGAIWRRRQKPMR